MPLRFSDGALRLGASSDHALPRCLAPGYPSVRRTGVKLWSVSFFYSITLSLEMSDEPNLFLRDRILGLEGGLSHLSYRVATSRRRFRTIIWNRLEIAVTLPSKTSSTASEGCASAIRINSIALDLHFTCGVVKRNHIAKI